VLQVVRDDAHEPDAERDGRVPRLVDDLVEVRRVQPAQEVEGLLGDGVVVPEQQLGGRVDERDSSDDCP